MVGVMHVELQTTCSALGYQEGDVYHKEPDCLETVKDLIRFLKREDEACEIRRQLGGAQIVQNDLVPILRQYGDDRILWETIVRLLVNLTQPAVLCFENHVPEDKIQRNYFLEIESHLQAYKEAFADEALFAVITKKLGDLLQLDWEHRQEEDRLLIERILILVRNVLHVPPNVTRDQRTDDDASIHDQVLWALHVSGLEDLLLFLASSEEERQFAFHVLEIIALMFREQTPEQLASAGMGRTLTEREKDERELELMREEERAKKKAAVQKYSSRHSRFGGTFVMSNVKSISEREVIMHRPVKNLHDLSFDKNKNPRKKPKNRRPLTESEYTRRSTLSIRMFLKEFCTQFLESCYNPLMSAVKDTLMRAGAQENDETYYLWTMRFFMEFQRRHSFRVDLIGETMSVQAFHYVQTNMTNYHEMLLTNKKEAIIWSRRMHLALRAYYELLQSLCMMDRSKDHGVRESAKIIKSNVFYMMEYRDVFLTLLKKFDETRQSRGFLHDLVDATHLFLKMLETHCTKTGHMVVQKKKKKKGKRKPKPAATNQEVTLTPQELDDLWDEVSSDLSAIFQGRVEVPTGVLPFDAASQIDVDQQRAEAMIRIQESMRGHRAGEAVALFRAAREVWPENEQFGKADINPEEEFMALREVFLAQLPRSQAASQEPEPQDEIEDEEDEERPAAYETVDEQFNFKEFVARFANPQIIRAYTILLSNYRKNSAATNHAIVKMFHRAAFNSGVIGLLFQASLFRVFLSILNDPASKTSHYKEMVTFVSHVVRKFFEVAENNKLIFMELFFLKNVKEAVELVDGYGCTKDSVKGKTAWTEEQEQELKDLFERFQHEEVPGKDMADLIMDQLTDSTKTRRQIINAMVHLGLIGSAKELKRKAPTMRQRGWQEEEEAELKTLFDQHREAPDPVAEILAVMSNPRSKVLIKKKLLELGLVSDLKELRKKRASKSDGGSRKKGKGDKDVWGSDDEVDDDLPSFSSESEDEDRARRNCADSDGASGGESDGGDDPMYVKNIKRAAGKLFKKDKAGAIQWLQTSLMSIAEDREEDDDDEPIPLVPLTDIQEDAMEDKDFQSLLKEVGIKQPANEQERFWRVPGSLTSADLQSRITALRAPIPGEEPSPGRPEKKTDSRREKLKALAKQKKEAGKEKRNSTGEGKGKRRSRFRAEVGEMPPPEEAAREGSERADSGQEKGSTPQTGSGQRAGVKRPRGWKEEEEAELKTLFDQHREAPDPVSEILTALSKPRSKIVIKKKLLELGLVSDLKELRKKRASKSGGGSKKGKGKSDKDVWGSDGEIDDDLPNFTSESENEDDAPHSRVASDSASGGDSDGGVDPKYVKNIRGAAGKVFAKDKAAAVQWLQTSLTSIAEDREEDDDEEPIPLVPLTDIQEDAMEDKDFQSLLKKVGIKPPANEQQRFWRVPGSLTPADLRSRVTALRAPVPGEEPSPARPEKKTDSRRDKLKALATQKKEVGKEKGNSTHEGKGKRRSRFSAEVAETAATVEVAVEDSDSTPQAGSGQWNGSSHSASPSRSQSSPSQTGSNRKLPAKKAGATKKRVRRAMNSDSSDDSDADRLVITDEASRDSLPQTKRARVVEAESSHNDEPLGMEPPAVNGPPTIDSDSDDEPLAKKTESFPATAFTMEEGSDSDVDDHVPLRRGVKRAALIESDEDE